MSRNSSNLPPICKNKGRTLLEHITDIHEVIILQTAHMYMKRILFTPLIYNFRGLINPGKQRQHLKNNIHSSKPKF